MLTSLISLEKLRLFMFISLTMGFSSKILAAEGPNFNLMIAPGTVSYGSVTLLWDKQYEPQNAIYQILFNDKLFGTTNKTNFTAKNLTANTWYTVKITVKGSTANAQNVLRFKTNPKGKVLNILDFGAKADTAVNNMISIQAAINACPVGGTVYIPAGNFKSGALFLKSDMTLYIEKGGVLKGSTAIGDYLPMIYNRFEGWELNTYASLLNAGKLNRDGKYVVKNLTITGEGTISGGGRRLGEAMTKASGIRSRGRLICLMNCQNVSISKLTVTEPPSWTIHYIYSDKISCHDLNIITRNIRNGDGIDPDSSTDSYIFNCTFDTGDDCIAIKSGKNPEGFIVAKPTRNVRITHCEFIRGHGISIGSEMSGGVSDVLVQDCKAGALLHGMQIKATKDRGGYVRNVTVADCQLQQITIFSAVNYNNDGEPAPNLPTFENFVFQNIDLSIAGSKEAVININGFKDPAHKLRNVLFSNITLPENAAVIINDSEQVKFEKVLSLNGIKPKYTISNSSGISH
jgi:exo-poly-alpha-galacturonosidase